MSSEFFVIDHIEKDSHFINLTFSAEKADQWIDCGDIESEVGAERFEVKAASDTTYKKAAGIYIFVVTRDVDVEGKVNVLLRDIGPHRTNVKVNVRYVVTTRVLTQPPSAQGTTMAFNSGGEAQDELGFVCRPTNALEAMILDGIESRASSLQVEQ